MRIIRLHWAFKCLKMISQKKSREKKKILMISFIKTLNKYKEKKKKPYKKFELKSVFLSSLLSVKFPMILLAPSLFQWPL
ncbi:hypothetical protein BpHYR1_009283 [Brachionus plicatilis]|uniref:Uncharacterized protein n=1 Tax=Brachionus plicatilis TaxID=10195 RepID=A0A3M7T280_BRAPC|nr:hypothetical protein BpHYR1_009283 [Brachionus plicatilis]